MIVVSLMDRSFPLRLISSSVSCCCAFPCRTRRQTISPRQIAQEAFDCCREIPTDGRLRSPEHVDGQPSCQDILHLIYVIQSNQENFHWAKHTEYRVDSISPASSKEMAGSLSERRDSCSHLCSRTHMIPMISSSTCTAEQQSPVRPKPARQQPMSGRYMVEGGEAAYPPPLHIASRTMRHNHSSALMKHSCSMAFPSPPCAHKEGNGQSIEALSELHHSRSSKSSYTAMLTFLPFTVNWRISSSSASVP